MTMAAHPNEDTSDLLAAREAWRKSETMSARAGRLIEDSRQTLARLRAINAAPDAFTESLRASIRGDQ